MFFGEFFTLLLPMETGIDTVQRVKELNFLFKHTRALM